MPLGHVLTHVSELVWIVAFVKMEDVTHYWSVKTLTVWIALCDVSVDHSGQRPRRGNVVAELW